MGSRCQDEARVSTTGNVMLPNSENQEGRFCYRLTFDLGKDAISVLCIDLYPKGCDWLNSVMSSDLYVYHS